MELQGGKCGSCSAEVNGMPKLMCMTRMSELPLEKPVMGSPDTASRSTARIKEANRGFRAAAGKPKVVVTTAIAREMVGFIWAIARIAQPEII